MNERKRSDFCTAMLVFSILIRLLIATGVDARAQALAAHLFAPPDVQYSKEENADEASVPAVRNLPVIYDAYPAPEADSADKTALTAPLAFDASEADGISITGSCTYDVDKTALLTRASTLDFSLPGPKVLIVHTHTSEAYTPELGLEYDASDPYRTGDAAYSVIRVGDEIAAALEQAGIETLHETSLNDYPSYNGAYTRMEATIEAYLAQYPSIQMVLDVHRDAALLPDGSQAAFTANVDGENAAQVMLVVGTDEGGLTHPDWQENLANALKLQALLNRSVPGLCRDLDLRTERFNQHLTHGSLLAEFGAAGNTLSEAVRAGQLFGQSLAQLICALSAQAYTS